MMQIPLKDGGVFAVIEPGNIQRMKSGKSMIVGNSLVAFTPDMAKFMELLGVNSLPAKGECVEHQVQITPEQIEAALKACAKLPEVAR